MHGEGKTLILCVTCPLKTLRIHTYVVLHCVLLGFTSLSVLFLFPLLITLFSFWTGFDAISSIINNRVFQLTSTGGVTFWLKWPKTTWKLQFWEWNSVRELVSEGGELSFQLVGASPSLHPIEETLDKILSINSSASGFINVFHRDQLTLTCWTQLVLYDWSSNTGAIDVKMDGSVLEEKSSFKMLGLIFSSKLDWGSYIISIAKTAS